MGAANPVDPVAAEVLRALEHRHRRGQGWIEPSALAAELKIGTAEVTRALAVLAAEGRIERTIEWGRHGVAVLWRCLWSDSSGKREAAG